MPKRDQLSLTAAIGQPRWLRTAPDDTAKPAGLAAALHRNTLSRLDAFDAEVDALRSSGKYTPAGLTEEVAKIAGKHKAEILKFRSPLNQVRAAAEKLRAKFKPVGIDLATHGALIAGVWAQLPRGDVLSVETIYREALAKGDHLTAAAIEQIPFFADNRPRSEVVAEGVRLRMMVEDPASVAELDTLDAAARDVARALEYVEAEIDRAAGVPAPDPTRVAAEGKKAAQGSEHAEQGGS